MRYGSPEKPRPVYPYPSSPRKSRGFDESFESEGDFEPVMMDEERRASRALLQENFRASRAMLVSEEHLATLAPTSEAEKRVSRAEVEERAPTREERRKSRIGGIAEKRVSRLVEQPMPPAAVQGNGQVSPTSPSRVRTRAPAGALEPVRKSVVEDSLEATYYPIVRHLGEPDLLDGLILHSTLCRMSWLMYVK